MKNYLKKRKTYKQKIAAAKKRFRTEIKIRWHVIKTNPNVFIQPIESHITGIGIPDLYVRSSFSFWCELKTIKRKVVEIVSPDWRPNQLNWARKYIDKGGRWILLISINDKLYYTPVPQEKYNLSDLFEFKDFTDKDFTEHLLAI